MTCVMSEPPFFTWTEETYADLDSVPEKLRTQIQLLWRRGARADELSHVFNLPMDWIHAIALAPDEVVVPKILN